MSLAILICFAGSIAGGLSFCRLADAFFGSLHVDDLSDDQFERDQLLSKIGAWRSCRCDSVLHLRRRGVGAPGHGGRQRCFGHAQYGFVLATVFAALLFAGLLLNWIYNPARERLVARLKPIQVGSRPSPLRRNVHVYGLSMPPPSLQYSTLRS